MPRPGWNGRRVTNALAWLYRNTTPPVCWTCQHHVTRPAASIGHILSAHDYPELEWNPSNWRLEHRTKAGTPTGCQHPGCTCQGNVGRGTTPHTAPPTREW